MTAPSAPNLAPQPPSNECRTNVAKHLCSQAGDSWHHGRKRWLKAADEVIAIVRQFQGQCK